MYTTNPTLQFLLLSDNLFAVYLFLYFSIKNKTTMC